MNITLLHYSAPPVVGGVESVLAHHTRLMANAGHSVRVIAGRGSQFDPRVEFVLLSLVDSQHPDILSAKAELDEGTVPSNFEHLVEAILQELVPALAGMDVLVIHNVCSLHKNLALTAALKTLSKQADAPRLILWHHDLAWTAPRYRAELYDGYPWDLLCTAWPRATQVVVSELRRTELADLMNISVAQIAVVANGIDTSEFLKLELQTRELVEHLGLLAAEPLLLLPVRITTRKNIELALHALAALRQVMPDARLVVTGPLGPHNPANAGYFTRLKTIRAELRLEGCAHFLTDLVNGYLPDEVIADFYRLADALILPSREEGFGIPVIEAGLSGLPIFCADIPTLRALGGDEATYFLPDAGPREVAALIRGRLVSDPLYRMRVRVRRAYTWEGVYAKLIEPLLEKKP
jgi:glycosyltransferase involved in cell wall biosynthesis